ncbi:MAG: 30S ribosomal protein S6 [Candidatus Uhrbacteria bacterium]|nr:30S ribosomal protein S6 [Candidatus Uhrbacteria bacterium]
MTNATIWANLAALIIVRDLVPPGCPDPKSGPNAMIYEILAIVPSKFSDTEIDGAVQNVSTAIEAVGAKIEKTQNLGKLKLAYPINHVRFGTYVLFYISAEPSAMLKIDQTLRLADEVLRHVTIARPDGIPVFTFRMAAYQPPLNAEGRRSSEREERPAARPGAAPEGEKRMSTEELNDKLDQILDSDIMKNI